VVFRVEGEFVGVAADWCGDGASDEWAGDAALAVLSEYRLKPVLLRIGDRLECLSHIEGTYPPPGYPENREITL